MADYEQASTIWPKQLSSTSLTRNVYVSILNVTTSTMAERIMFVTLLFIPGGRVQKLFYDFLICRK